MQMLLMKLTERYASLKNDPEAGQGMVDALEFVRSAPMTHGNRRSRQRRVQRRERCPDRDPRHLSVIRSM